MKIVSLCVVPIAALLLTACGSDSTAPNEPLSVASISPPSGLLAGGTTVTITGTNFIDVTDVTIGGIALGNRTVVSSTQITGTTPAATNTGAKDVVVTSNTHGSSVCNGCFSYRSVRTAGEKTMLANLATLGRTAAQRRSQYLDGRRSKQWWR
jgi:hypothetical protein